MPHPLWGVVKDHLAISPEKIPTFGYSTGRKRIASWDLIRCVSFWPTGENLMF
jgi:hypothetical protein